jgi:thioesterase domain-containing protein
LTLPIIAEEGMHSHLVPIRKSGTRPMLFCLPGVGDDISAGFLEMANALPEAQPVCGFRWPTMNGTTDLFSVEQLAKLYLGEIRKTQQEGPYYLCGQSLGGLIAYEIATLLVSEGEEIGVLALFDADNPAFVANLSLRDSLKFRRKYLLDRTRKYFQNICRGKIVDLLADAWLFLGGRITTAVSIRIRTMLRRFDQPVPSKMRSRVLSFTAAWHAYCPREYTKKLVLFRAGDRRAEYDDDETLGWKMCVRGGVEVHVIPGDHVTMMQSPHVELLVAELTRYLG